MELYKIDILTTELERCSQALSDKAIECEQWKIKALTLEHKVNDLIKENQLLNQQYIGLSERLQERVTEVEELRSKLLRIQSITMKESEDRIEKLIKEVERLNQIIDGKGFEHESNRQQITSKIQELQEERQKSYHFENFIKQLKSEKLQALHQLKQKDEQYKSALATIEELQQSKVQAMTLQVDIETIRQNYSTLYEQHKQEVGKLNEQIETQRQVNDNNMKIMQRQYSDLLQKEKASLQADLQEQYDSKISQMQNDLDAKDMIIQKKTNEYEAAKLQKFNEFQELQSIKNLELSNQIQLANEKVRKAEQSLLDWKKSAELNQQLLTRAENQQTQLQMKCKEQFQEINLLKQKQQDLNEQLRVGDGKRQDLETKLSVMLNEAMRQREEVQTRDQQYEQLRIKYAQLEAQFYDARRQSSEIDRRSEINEADQKIKYLLKLLETREGQIEQLNARLQYLSPQRALQPPMRETIPKSDIVDRRSSVSNQDNSLSNIFQNQGRI